MLISLKKTALLLAIIGTMAISQVSATDKVSQELLNDYWSTTKGKETNRYFTAQKDRTPESIYAFALVKTRQHDVKMALRAIEVLQKMDPETAKPVRLKVWLQLRQDRIEPAMASLIEYIKLIDQNSKLTAFERKDAMEFAGRIVGFLDGPVVYKVSPGERDAMLKQVLGRMNDDDHASFEVGYSNVANKFKGMMSEKMKVDADAAAQDAVVQKAKFESLAVKEQQLHEAEQRTSQERKQTRETINKGLTDIARKDLEFANQPRFFARYATPYVVRPYAHYKVHTSGSIGKHVHYKFAGHGVPGYGVPGYGVRRPVYVRGGVYNNGLHARRNILAGHYAQLRDLGAGQMNSLNKELKEISKAKNRTMNQKLRALKPSGKIVTKSVALKAKSRSIMTYEQFPLEIERQLLLAATR